MYTTYSRSWLNNIQTLYLCIGFIFKSLVELVSVKVEREIATFYSIVN